MNGVFVISDRLKLRKSPYKLPHVINLIKANISNDTLLMGCSHCPTTPTLNRDFNGYNYISHSILAAPTQKPSPTLTPVGSVIGVALGQCEHATNSGCVGSTN